ncbi:MAG: FecR domain-containing protein [Elusimicrobia bacterium]|nr:FecR domain-containing protein [Elusimicrobiota bacterium]
MKGFAFFVVAVAVLVLPAAAQDASLALVSGPVSILAGGAERFVKAKGGEQLLYGDTVRVGKGGVAHLILGDRGAVLLREESLLTLQGSPRRTTLAVKFGEFLIGLKKGLEPGQSFKVRTPAAVAAVRGTLFWGKSDKADQSAAYAGFGHVVAVTAQGKTVLVEPGKTVTVAFGQAPADAVPSTVGLEYANHFAIDGGVQGLGDLAETDKLGK